MSEARQQLHQIVSDMDETDANIILNNLFDNHGTELDAYREEAGLTDAEVNADEVYDSLLSVIQSMKSLEERYKVIKRRYLRN